jgi:hypothetical protein
MVRVTPPAALYPTCLLVWGLGGIQSWCRHWGYRISPFPVPGTESQSFSLQSDTRETVAAGQQAVTGHSRISQRCWEWSNICLIFLVPYDSVHLHQYALVVMLPSDALRNVMDTLLWTWLTLAAFTVNFLRMESFWRNIDDNLLNKETKFVSYETRMHSV